MKVIPEPDLEREDALSLSLSLSLSPQNFNPLYLPKVSNFVQFYIHFGSTNPEFACDYRAGEFGDFLYLEDTRARKITQLFGLTFQIERKSYYGSNFYKFKPADQKNFAKLGSVKCFRSTQKINFAYQKGQQHF